ncbi:hypothetical protein LINGRAHAP2_LOCUS7626, partial [Linum grandiflorum]
SLFSTVQTPLILSSLILFVLFISPHLLCSTPATAAATTDGQQPSPIASFPFSSRSLFSLAHHSLSNLATSSSLAHGHYSIRKPPSPLPSNPATTAAMTNSDASIEPPYRRFLLAKRRSAGTLKRLADDLGPPKSGMLDEEWLTMTMSTTISDLIPCIMFLQKLREDDSS